MGDIVRTIIVEPTVRSVFVLGMIVVIRIVLSFSLEVEIDGVWPWSRWRLGRGGSRETDGSDARRPTLRTTSDAGAAAGRGARAPGGARPGRAGGRDADPASPRPEQLR